MRAANWRDRIWETLEQPWDVLVIGGGISGAAILRKATRAGWRTLLVEQRDFSSGTSSRSSKLVHGGFRYLNQGQLHVVRDSVRQRRRLIAEAPGLIEPVGFTFAHYHGDRPSLWVYQLGLALYDLMAAQWNHQRYDGASYARIAPHVTRDGLVAGLRCMEATTDDARLVFRLIADAVAEGGTALNYVAATTLLLEHDRVVGARVRDTVSLREAEVRARVVINATGAWADQVRGQLDGAPCVRPLRGSHLVFPAWRFPIAQVIAFRHPLDRRYVMVVPWEEMTLVGTTDLDHRQTLDQEPTISPDEVAYLMAGIEAVFPSLALTLDDVVATFSGVRPVIDTGKADPSKEARDHLVLAEHGLVTVTGGKLTTFDLLAHDVLAVARSRLPEPRALRYDASIFESGADELPATLSERTRRRLHGRYGAAAAALVATARGGELERIPGTTTLWAELRWAARHERVVHLDDLLLRRVRLGVQVEQGAAALLPRIRSLCQEELGWDDSQWLAEEAAYQGLWRKHYSLPEKALVPDWHVMLAQVHRQRQGRQEEQLKYARRRRAIALVVSALLALSAVIIGRRVAQQQRSVSSQRRRSASDY
jgi:glycerol-3-phosphate dehydrogenase